MKSKVKHFHDHHHSTTCQMHTVTSTWCTTFLRSLYTILIPSADDSMNVSHTYPSHDFPQQTVVVEAPISSTTCCLLIIFDGAIYRCSDQMRPLQTKFIKLPSLLPCIFLLQSSWEVVPSIQSLSRENETKMFMVLSNHLSEYSEATNSPSRSTVDSEHIEA